MKYQKTWTASPSNIERKWYVVDAEGMVLGRLASQVAAILRGKNKPTFTPHFDTGDYVIVINADKVVLTGNKEDQKEYKRYSGYSSGLKNYKIQRHEEYLPRKNCRTRNRRHASTQQTWSCNG